jgi:hypothetical protein
MAQNFGAEVFNEQGIASKYTALIRRLRCPLSSLPEIFYQEDVAKSSIPPPSCPEIISCPLIFLSSQTIFLPSPPLPSLPHHGEFTRDGDYYLADKQSSPSKTACLPHPSPPHDQTQTYHRFSSSPPYIDRGSGCAASSAPRKSNAHTSDRWRAPADGGATTFSA